MSHLFQSLKDKAQSAVNSSGIAERIPGGFGRGDGKTSPPSGQSSSGLTSFTKSHTFESIHHQLRSFQQQYSSSTTPVQKIITSAKGVALDYDTVARDAQAYSKEMYLWGQTEDAEDIKDVTDRLGWLNYLHGSLASQFASKIDAARSPFKALRDAENVLAPTRNMRTGLQNQIARMEYDQYDQRAKPEKQQKLQDLRAQLQKLEAEDEDAEKEILILKRKAIKESEQLKWEAVREYAEKLSLVAQAAISLVPALPSLPPSSAQPYAGAQLTASVRASLQHSLDNYSPGDTNFLVGKPGESDLKHTRSFGVTHAQELSRIGYSDANSNIPLTPPLSGATASPPGPSNLSQSPAFPQPVTSSPSPGNLSFPQPVTSSSSYGSSPYPYQGSSPPATAPSPASVSQPLNPALLNQAPAPIPTTHNATSPIVAPNSVEPVAKIPSATPTVAETGVPKSAGPEGPGPVSGSLLGKKPSPPGTSPVARLPPAVPAKFESAEEEKRRLEREEREKLLHGEGGSHGDQPTPKYETAAEEKERLERERRERDQRQHDSGPHPPPGHEEHPDHDNELPPYQEF